MTIKTRSCVLLCGQKTTLPHACGECWMELSQRSKAKWVAYTRSPQPLGCRFGRCQHERCMCAQLRCGHQLCKACGIGHGLIVVTAELCPSCQAWLKKYGRLEPEVDEAA